MDLVPVIAIVSGVASLMFFRGWWEMGQEVSRGRIEENLDLDSRKYE